MFLLQKYKLTQFRRGSSSVAGLGWIPEKLQWLPAEERLRGIDQNKLLFEADLKCRHCVEHTTFLQKYASAASN